MANRYKKNKEQMKKISKVIFLGKNWYKHLFDLLLCLYYNIYGDSHGTKRKTNNSRR